MMGAAFLRQGVVADVRLSPVDRRFGIAVRGEFVGCRSDPGDQAITIGIRALAGETEVRIPREALECLETAVGGLVEGIFVDEMMTVWMEFDMSSVSNANRLVSAMLS